MYVLVLFYLFFKKVHLQEDENKIVITAKTHVKLFLSGFFINTLNPAVIIFWLTTATAIAASHTIHERVIIFSTCLICNLSADVFKVLLAQKVRSKLNEHSIKLINRFTGLLLFVFGIALLLGVIFSIVKH